MNATLLSYSIALPEMFLAAMALCLLMAGAFMRPAVANGVIPSLTRWSFLGAFIILMMVWTGEGPLRAFERGDSGLTMFSLNGFNVFIKAVLLLFAVVVLYFAKPFLMRAKILAFEYYILHIFSVIGMMLMVSARDFIMVYVGMEMMSFSLYILCGFNREDPRSAEAGLKYFVLGSLASGIMLFGISLFYGLAGDTSYEAVGMVMRTDIMAHEHALTLTVALVLMMTGLVFKISAVPFHMWTPDVYEGAPTPVTAFMAVLPKIAAFALLLQILYGPLAGAATYWYQMLSVLAVLTMAVGSMLAIVQDNLKRLLAYSSIANVGFVLVGLVCGTVEGATSMLFYLVIYGIMTLGAFAVVIGFHKRGTVGIDSMNDLKGLSKDHPVMAACMLIFMFSLAGVPPMAGFFAKFYLFSAAVQAHLVWLAVLGVILSVVSAYYCLRVVKVMYFDSPEEELYSPSFGMRVMIGILAAITLGLCLMPGLLLAPARQAAVVMLGI